MNWYKHSQMSITNFEERNTVNDKIHYLDNVAEVLTNMAKVVFQNGRVAKDVSYNLIVSKKMTSYPGIRDIIIEANRLALDSPWKFEALCKEAAEAVRYQVEDLKTQRDDFVNKTQPQKLKGFIDG